MLASLITVSPEFTSKFLPILRGDFKPNWKFSVAEVHEAECHRGAAIRG